MDGASELHSDVFSVNPACSRCNRLQGIELDPQSVMQTWSFNEASLAAVEGYVLHLNLEGWSSYTAQYNGRI